MAEASYTPRDDFPPHGYLDNPAHSWKLNPCGVLRSRPPAGMGWHTPSYGSYGRHQLTHRAHLHVGIEAAGLRLLTPAEFSAHRVLVSCDLHTRNRLRYAWTHPAGLRIAVTYFLVNASALGCAVTVERTDAAGLAAQAVAPAWESASARIWVAHELAHNPATSRLWEHGTYVALPGAADPATGHAGLVGICPEGDAWAHGAASSDGVPLAPDSATPISAPWTEGAPVPAAPASREPPDLQTAILALAYDLDLPADGGAALQAALVCDVSADCALARWREVLPTLPAILAERAEDDERFWAHAPRLDGDWPAHWRRGLATDLETLRMTIRPPAGVFSRPWDGMQIQAPRAVLAETALDALSLAWAEPELARNALLACFASALRPNVPCMREDGSYNMVADDGSICGTGPEWGWPLAAADDLWRRSGDRPWLAALYPHAAAYVDWWLAHRLDDEGWLVHACSWESGQDVSTRFGVQQTGGSDVRHLRPVDLQAAVAQGCAILAAWATTLERPADEIARWQAAATSHTAHVHNLWHDGWYHDFDARRRRWSGVRDPMQLAPLACGVAKPEHAAALGPAFAALPPHGGSWPPLVWPPVAHTVLEAALAVGMDMGAADLAAGVNDHAWTRMDARELEADGGLPGITREFWPHGGPGVSAGIEGYGWGALTVHFLVRHIVGLRALSPTSFLLVPALPPSSRRPGAAFRIGPVAYGAGTISLHYRIPDEVLADAVDITLDCSGVWGTVVARRHDDARELARGTADAAGNLRLEWRGTWLRGARVERL